MVVTTLRAGRLLCLAAMFSVGAQATAFSNCDVLHPGSITVAGVQAVINEALGIRAAANDLSNMAAGSATTLTASLAIAGSAATGARTLTVDGLTLASAFTVTPPLSVTYSYDSQRRLATASYILATGGTTTVTYTYDAAGNGTSVVAH
jgi:hypothetical protein